MAFQHDSLYAGKFEGQLGVFVRPGSEDVPAETVVIRAPPLLAEKDASLDPLRRCMKLALGLRSADPAVVEALYPREQEFEEELVDRKAVTEAAEKLMEEQPKWEEEGVDFSAMEPEERKKIVWLFEKAYNNVLYTAQGSIIFGGMAHYLNHSCMPNAVWKVDSETGELIVKTVKNVEANEEITIGYFAIRDSKVDLFSELGEYYGFTCHCDPCMMVYRIIDPDRFPPPDEERKITIEKPLRLSQMPYLLNWYQNTCTWCGKRPEKLLTCSRCQAAKFCNRDCQAADWAALHKGFCPTMKEWRETGVIVTPKPVAKPEEAAAPVVEAD